MHDTADFMAQTYALGSGPWTMTPVTRGTVTAAQREFAGNQVVACVRGVPDLAVISRLTEALTTVW
ncbi:hypothetical protein ACU639_28590 [Streptomyces cynarae]|uniref:hypothetical protein n=1 Tax=Streptomyces cynarae TaxID=2981134 RepID=UPI00406D4427